MRLISFAGLLALLLIAWAMSYHRRTVVLRTVLWGIAPQLMFAVIILRRDAWSYAGMTALGLLTVMIGGFATIAGMLL